MPARLGWNEVLGPNVAEARNATVLGLNDVDKQKLEEARQLAMSMTSHPVAVRSSAVLGVLVAEKEKYMQGQDYRVAGRTVVVEYVNPPMELRDFDYCAHFLSNDLGDPQGYGMTAAAALEDLREKCE